MTQQYVPVLQVLVLCTSTPGTGSVRTQYVHTPGQPVTHPPGFISYTPGIVSCSFTYSCFTYIFDSHSSHVPYEDWGMIMMDRNLVGQCGEGQLAARNKIMDRYYPDWIDNKFSTQKLMQRLPMPSKVHSRVRRLELIEQEEDEKGMSGACPLIMWR